MSKISSKIAAAARDMWIEKAAGFRVAAQVATGHGMVPSATYVDDLIAKGDEAERMAQEWAAKVGVRS